MNIVNASKLSIGPVLGHTTDNSVKVWGRAKSSSMKGIIELYCLNSDMKIVEPLSFDEALDNTGVAHIHDVKNKLAMNADNRSIQYRVGCIAQDIVIRNDTVIEWSDIGYISIKLAPSEPDSAFDFIFGSCRHLDMGVVDQKKDDRCFKVIENNKYEDAPRQADFNLFLGDQVYADHPKRGFFSWKMKKKLQSDSHYNNIYHDAWKRNYFSKVVSKCPSLMMWDDHEVLNDWNADKIARKEWHETAYKHGEKYFRAYQSALNPNNYEQGFYYSFSYGMGDFFVMDVRSDKSPLNNVLIGNKQKEAFKEWILRPSSNIKFIVSPVPVIPDSPGYFGSLSIFRPLNVAIGSGAKDRWDVFPNEREWLFDLIETYQKSESNRPVVILSEDVHCSYGAKITCKSDYASNLNVYQLVSSGFNWPLPGLNRKHFDFKNPLKIDGRFKSKLMPEFIGDIDKGDIDKVMISHNFCYVSVTHDSIKADWYSEHGNKLHSVNIDL